MNVDILNIKGTDINYYFICRRRAWMSLKNFYIIDKNQFVAHGDYLSKKKRRYGFTNIKLGRNVLDNLEITPNDNYIVHEFKRGKKVLPGDIFQVLHYMNILRTKGYTVENGEIHTLGSKDIKIIKLDEDAINELNTVYTELEKLRNEIIPDPIRNYYCNHGCSYSSFCWG
ncbi:Dna2/Cas4 domain-containing protein [Ferroplasma acidiphilum]|nr:Dna2/Cas4 domain-containing protein [Ferroplasma acidiphilum]